MQQFVESFKGCFPVEHLLNPFDLVVTDLAEVCAFGIELADEAIGVLVGAALPGAMRMCEVDLDVRVLGKQPVFGHFLAPVMGQRQAHLLWQCPHAPGKGAAHADRVLGLQPHQQDGARGALHQRAQRTIPGHWESDLIMGHSNRTALGTLVERTTRTVLLVRLQAKDAISVRRAFARRMRTLPQQMRLSLTHDRGKEMAEHRLFTQDTHIQVYFAHPHSPWERGTNENTNGLIRQFYPKGTDFGQVSHYQIKRVQQLLNGRPRKVLNWKTPFETFNELLH